MPSNWALFTIDSLAIPGKMMPAPVAPRVAGQVDLAEDTASDTITVTGDAAALVVVCDAKSRIDVRPLADQGDLDAAGSPEIVAADVPYNRVLVSGEYKLEIAAY